MIFIVRFHGDCHKNHVTNSEEAHKCPSVSEELSFCFKYEEAEICRSVRRFTRYSEAELRQTNLFVILPDDYYDKDEVDIHLYCYSILKSSDNSLNEGFSSQHEGLNENLLSLWLVICGRRS